MKFKTLKLSAILCCIIAIVSLESCECNGDVFDLEQGYILQFGLFDKKTKQNLLTIGGKYDDDSVEVHGHDGRILYPSPVRADGIIWLRPYFNSGLTMPLEKDTTEYYYLYLREKELDIDTLQIDYRTSLDDCNLKKFTKIDLYYNEELVYTNDNMLDSFYVELFK